MIQRFALVLPLIGLAAVVGTLAVLAVQPELEKPWPKAVILPSAAPKSLIVWLEYDLTYSETSAVAFRATHREPAFQPVRFYAGSESPENLIAERVSAGRLQWGPKALDAPIVAWRGAGEIHLQATAGATESQVAEWTAQIQQLEPAAKVVLVKQ